nr:hypothetical protein [Tanacetum cinerariifolium]
MVDWLSNVKTDKVIHTMETDIMRLMDEMEICGKSSDEIDKETGSSDGLQPKQVDLSCVHAVNGLHSHEIRVVLKQRSSTDVILGRTQNSSTNGSGGLSLPIGIKLKGNKKEIHVEFKVETRNYRLDFREEGGGHQNRPQ